MSGLNPINQMMDHVIDSMHSITGIGDASAAQNYEFHQPDEQFYGDDGTMHHTIDHAEYFRGNQHLVKLLPDLIYKCMIFTNVQTESHFYCCRKCSHHILCQIQLAVLKCQCSFQCFPCPWWCRCIHPHSHNTFHRYWYSLIFNVEEISTFMPNAPGIV